MYWRWQWLSLFVSHSHLPLAFRTVCINYALSSNENNFHMTTHSAWGLTTYWPLTGHTVNYWYLKRGHLRLPELSRASFNHLWFVLHDCPYAIVCGCVPCHGPTLRPSLPHKRLTDPLSSPRCPGDAQHHINMATEWCRPGWVRVLQRESLLKRGSLSTARRNNGVHRAKRSLRPGSFFV